MNITQLLNDFVELEKKLGVETGVITKDDTCDPPKFSFTDGETDVPVEIAVCDPKTHKLREPKIIILRNKTTNKPEKIYFA